MDIHIHGNSGSTHATDRVSVGNNYRSPQTTTALKHNVGLALAISIRGRTKCTRPKVNQMSLRVYELCTKTST